LAHPLGVNLLWVLARAGITIVFSTAEVGKGLDDYKPTLFGASEALHQFQFRDNGEAKNRSS
jgi:hypothetical protein